MDHIYLKLASDKLLWWTLPHSEIFYRECLLITLLVCLTHQCTEVIKYDEVSFTYYNWLDFQERVSAVPNLQDPNCNGKDTNDALPIYWKNISQKHYNRFQNNINFCCGDVLHTYILHRHTPWFRTNICWPLKYLFWVRFQLLPFA